MGVPLTDQPSNFWGARIGGLSGTLGRAGGGYPWVSPGDDLPTSQRTLVSDHPLDTDSLLTRSIDVHRARTLCAQGQRNASLHRDLRRPPLDWSSTVLLRPHDRLATCARPSLPPPPLGVRHPGHLHSRGAPSSTTGFKIQGSRCTTERSRLRCAPGTTVIPQGGTSEVCLSRSERVWRRGRACGRVGGESIGQPERSAPGPMAERVAVFRLQIDASRGRSVPAKRGPRPSAPSSGASPHAGPIPPW